jgi:hypothetical protein
MLTPQIKIILMDYSHSQEPKAMRIPNSAQHPTSFPYTTTHHTFPHTLYTCFIPPLLHTYPSSLSPYTPYTLTPPHNPYTSPPSQPYAPHTHTCPHTLYPLTSFLPLPTYTFYIVPYILHPYLPTPQDCPSIRTLQLTHFLISSLEEEREPPRPMRPHPYSVLGKEI